MNPRRPAPKNLQPPLKRKDRKHGASIAPKSTQANMTGQSTSRYRSICISPGGDGAVVLVLPQKFVRDLKLKSGDTVKFRRRTPDGWPMCFFRRVNHTWRQIMPDGTYRLVRNPR